MRAKPNPKADMIYVTASVIVIKAHF